MTAPRRLEKRQAHLDARIVPVEAALLARADALDNKKDGTLGGMAEGIVAAEFRALAEELHWFG